MSPGRGAIRRWSAIVISGAVVAWLLPAIPFIEAAGAQTGSITLNAPSVLHSTGAELSWSKLGGAIYEVHRSTSGTFTPSAATRIATIGDADMTSYIDRTAAAAQTFTYKIASGPTISNGQTVTLPAAGKTTMTLQPDGPEGQDAWISFSNGSTVCTNYGANTELRVGYTTSDRFRSLLKFDLRAIPVDATIDSATLSLYHDALGVTPGTVDVHRVTGSWVEGSGGCGDGVNWYQSHAGTSWTSEGGDFDASVIASKVPSTDAGWDAFTVTSQIAKVAGASQVNHGFEIKYTTESIGSSSNYVAYYSSDNATAANRPKLLITYTDGAKPSGPLVAIGSPAPQTRVTGTVTVNAGASDDSRTTKVEFYLDGAATPMGTDTSAPYSFAWSTGGSSNGSHNLTAKAYDDAGNVTTSSGVPVTVDNSAGPTASLTSPAAGATVSGTVTVSASAAPPTGETIGRVEFYFDGILFATDTSSPYSGSWNTLDMLNTAFDGSHALYAKSYDSSGNVSTSASRTVTVANTRLTQYQASFKLATDGSDLTTNTAVFPVKLKENKDPAAPQEDPYNPDSPKRDLGSGPKNSTGGLSASSPTLQTAATGGNNSCPAAAFCLTTTVTNTSLVAWKGGDLQVWYRWYTPDGIILFEGPGNDYFPQTVQPGQSKDIPLTVYPPVLPPGVVVGQYRLRFDIYDTATGKWFGGKGNKPVDNPVIIDKELNDALGLERYFQFEGEDVGAGMSTLTNVANGNMLLHIQPFSSPGRGLSTVVDVTYNSLEDHSESPLGNNFSLNISTLSRWGNPIDIHPNKADEVSGHTNRYITFTDGDGTTHTFDGQVAPDGTVYWTEPAGVHLYLRHFSDTDPAKAWAFTRPDRVTFFYDAAGFPRSVVDKNGNAITFTYCHLDPPVDSTSCMDGTKPDEDPGGPKKRIISVTDPGGRSFLIDYYLKSEAKKPQIRGNIETITDHEGHRLRFDYYDDGNLLRMTQVGGTNADGSFLADRSWVFTYTVEGDDTPAASDLLNPDPHTPNQSGRIYSIADPRENLTKFDYYVANEGNAKDREKQQARITRTNDTTTYSYNYLTQITAASHPLGRTYKYLYDFDGKVTKITDPLNRDTVLTWSPDFNVTRVDEPGTPARSTRYTYNDNGYLTSFSDEVGSKTVLIYQNVAVDAKDRSPYWKAWRTIPHISQLSTKTNARGVLTTGDPDDFQWNFRYDSKGNLTQVIQPEPESKPVDSRYKTIVVYNANGTVSAVRDPDYDPANMSNPNNHTIRYTTYDANGLPTTMIDGAGATTRFGYDQDGLLIWIQDPNHANDTGSDEASYKNFLYYDDFHRLGMQSAPKSTKYERGSLIWGAASYDANDNVTGKFDPVYGGLEYPGPGPATTSRFDAMDRLSQLTNQDQEVSTYTYDAAGRLTKLVLPKGQSTSNPDDFSVQYVYDALDRPTKQIRYGEVQQGGAVEARHMHFCYDSAGDLASVTQPNAGITGTLTCPASGVPFTWTYGYDLDHRVVTSSDPLGNTRKQHFDPDDNTDWVQNENGDRTTFEYDGRGLRTKIVEPFDPAAGRSVVTFMQYDGVGNAITVVSPRGWDASPDKATFTNFTTRLTYDDANRMVKVRLPVGPDDPTLPGNEAEQSYIHRSFDANGNLLWASLPTTVSSPDNVSATAKTQMTYFDSGWVRTQDEGPNPKIHFDYSARGQQVKRVPEKKGSPGTLDQSLEMVWEYHPDGMLRARKDHGGNPSKYLYDANNNLIYALDAAGVVDPGEAPVETQADWTGFDQVKEVRHHKVSDTQSQNNWTFTDYSYDGNSNVTRRQEDGTKDPNLVQTQAPKDIRLTYDQADRLNQQKNLGRDNTCTGDEKVDTAYVATGWEKSRDISEPLAGTCTQDVDWVLRQTITWDYFANGKLKHTETKARQSGSMVLTQLHTVGYVDDANRYVNGNRVTDDYMLKGPGRTTCTDPQALCRAKNFYDPRDRLVKYLDGHGGTNTFTLDEPAHLLQDNTIRAGNITTQVDADGTRTRDYTGNQLTTQTVGSLTASYWYDALGNLDCVTGAGGTGADCSPSDQGTPSANLIADYGYDYLGRLESYRSYAGGTKTDSTNYAWDALDRLVKETESHDEWGGQNRSSTFGYQGLTPFVTQERITGRDPTTKSYSYDSFGHLISMTDDPDDPGQPTKNYTYAYDVHGSISQLIDETGQVQASYGYTPYGSPDKGLTAGDTADDVGQDALNPYRYAQRRMDTGMDAGTTAKSARFGIDMGARRFGPDTTRFIQQDFLFSALGGLSLSLDPLTQNRYGLAGGNPVSFVEWDGHMVIADGGGGSSISSNPTAESMTSGETQLVGGTGTSSDAGTYLRPMAPEEQERFELILRLQRIRETYEPVEKPLEYTEIGLGAAADLASRASNAGRTLATASDAGELSIAGRTLSEFRNSEMATNIARTFESPVVKWAGRGLLVAGFGMSVVGHMAEGETLGRAVTEAGVETGFGYLGGYAGFALGCVVLPGIGCVVGGIAGGIIGGIVGDAVAEPVADALGVVGGGIAAAADAVGDFFSGLF